MENDKQDSSQSIDYDALKTFPGSCENSTSQYTSALVHEFRNPLNNILLSVETLTDRVGNNLDDKILLDIIWRGAKRIGNLVDSILNQQNIITDHNEFSIHRLLDDVLVMVADRIRLKDIAVHKNYGQQDFTALMNEQEMKIALTNIMVNAVEAMASHTGQLDVVIKAVTGENKFVVQIVDNGSGISEKNLKDVFSSQFTTKRIGLGIGLSATYHILQANHVKVFVKSKEGTGTCFTLLFENA